MALFSSDKGDVFFPAAYLMGGKPIIGLFSCAPCTRSDRGCRQRAAQAAACPSSWPCSSRSPSASPWLDLTSFEHHVWFAFAVVVTGRGAGLRRSRLGSPLSSRAGRSLPLRWHSTPSA